MNMADTVNVTGYGIPGLDFYICAFGKFLAIETKAPGKKPTARQTLTINELRRPAPRCLSSTRWTQARSKRG
jgi:hypothetical protein